MILKKKLYITITVLVMSLTSIGCSSSKNLNVNEENFKFYTLTIDGDKEQYSEDSEDAVEIKNLSEKFISAKTSADYRKEYNGDELVYYTYSTRKMFEEANSEEITRNFIQTNKLVIEVDDYNIQKCEMYTLRGKEHSKIVVDYITTTVDATEEYFEENQIEKGVRYIRTMTMELAKVDDEWKVAEIIDLTPRKKAE